MYGARCAGAKGENMKWLLLLVVLVLLVVGLASAFVLYPVIKLGAFSGSRLVLVAPATNSFERAFDWQSGGSVSVEARQAIELDIKANLPENASVEDVLSYLTENGADCTEIIDDAAVCSFTRSYYGQETAGHFYNPYWKTVSRIDRIGTIMIGPQDGATAFPRISIDFSAKRTECPDDYTECLLK